MRNAIIVAMCLVAWIQMVEAQIVAVMPNGPKEDFASSRQMVASGEAGNSAKKGLGWLLKHQGETDWTTLAMLRDINDAYCHDHRIDDYIGKMLHELRPEMANSPFRRLIDGDTMYAFPDDAWHRRSTGPDIPDYLLVTAIYCDIHPLSKQADRMISGADLEKTDALPNLLLAMTLLEKNGCKDRGKNKDFGTIMRKVAEKLASKQAESANAYEERIGFLEFAGYSELVQQDWIRNIVTRQLASGAWSLRNNSPESPDPGATIRAVWALTRHMQECPLDSEPGISSN